MPDEVRSLLATDRNAFTFNMLMLVTRTLILETDLDEFLNNLEEAPGGSS
jgi:hypothetical protein